MIESHGIPYKIESPVIGRLVLHEDPLLDRFPLIFLRNSFSSNASHRFAGFITDMNKEECKNPPHFPGLFSTENIKQFYHGDGIALLPEGKALLVYRPKSNSNALFVTSQCNSNCIMCSQPPQKEGNFSLAELAFNIMSIIDPEIELLGITGGESTLLGDRFFLLVEMAKKRFPLATLHILTNGRYFSQTEKAHKLSLIQHPNIVLGIPFFSDNPYDHDSITRAHGSFDQTTKGIINLARFDMTIEIRIVMFRQVISRLNQIAEFIYRNFPFVSNVCFMGLEPIGHALQNFSQIWEDPIEYQSALEKAVEYLSLRGINVSIYNEQLCILNRKLWKYAQSAISDWKNIFIEECTGCEMREKCGGFFASSADGLHSRGIHKISNE